MLEIFLTDLSNFSFFASVVFVTKRSTEGIPVTAGERRAASGSSVTKSMNVPTVFTSS